VNRWRMAADERFDPHLLGKGSKKGVSSGSTEGKVCSENIEGRGDSVLKT